jgi:nitronate monooxygenase
MKALQIGTLSVAVPVIQGGMGVGISLSGLAAAVANEGGVGVISSAGLGLMYRDFSDNFLEASIFGLKEEIRKAREKTVGVIGVNVMVAMTNYIDMIKTAISEKIDIIIAGAGLPLDLPSFLKKDSITKLIPIVSSARATKIICEKWKANYDYLPDAVIVEGPKAGGHLGFREEQIGDNDYSLEKLVPEIVNELKPFEEKYNQQIPLIAAGGIYTGEDIRNIFELGASGVQMATRFVTTN